MNKNSFPKSASHLKLIVLLMMITTTSTPAFAGLFDRFYNVNKQLRIAIQENNLVKVKKVLAMPGVDVNRSNKAGQTPLILAISSKHSDVALALIQAPGIDVNQYSGSIFNLTIPLLMAIQTKQNEVALALIRAPRMILRNTINNVSPLSLATEMGNEAIANAIREALRKQPGFNESWFGGGDFGGSSFGGSSFGDSSFGGFNFGQSSFGGSHQAPNGGNCDDGQSSPLRDEPFRRSITAMSQLVAYLTAVPAQYEYTHQLSKNPTSAEVKSASKKALLKLHPDKPTGNAEEFKKFNKLYEGFLKEIDEK